MNTCFHIKQLPMCFCSTNVWHVPTVCVEWYIKCSIQAFINVIETLFYVHFIQTCLDNELFTSNTLSWTPARNDELHCIVDAIRKKLSFGWPIIIIKSFFWMSRIEVCRLVIRFKMKSWLYYQDFDICFFY